MLVTPATDEGSVIHVRGKGGTDRRIPVEQKLIEVLDTYLDSRAVRVPGGTKRRPTASGLAAWAATLPCSWVATVNASPAAHFNTACCAPPGKRGLDGHCAGGALVRALRHTYASELANADVSVYTLMKLLGHESMTISYALRQLELASFP